RATLEPKIAALGYSIGAAAALDYAAGHPIRRLILIAPFTSVLDMARKIVGWPLCNLAVDRFDNRARLDELAARSPRPPVLIVHGDADPVIPVRMGRELARLHPDWIRYHECPGGTHDTIVDAARETIFEDLKAK
ncbi:MAG: alpha/beta hydrolase, partial [Candidatus Sumerlaeota bacterium]|nr:alpha/beta hydrolase [Candidatus Sumerlaeota bacterium]